MESFVGSGVLVTQATVSLQKSGQLIKIKDQYECLVMRTEKMESAKYTFKEALQAIQELDFGEIFVTSTSTLKKECKTMTFLK